jgi:hypothetical protein
MKSLTQSIGRQGLWEGEGRAGKGQGDRAGVQEVAEVLGWSSKASCDDNKNSFVKFF